MAERKWSMETAARLLQYGVTGKQVAEAVGVVPSEISRHRDTLMSMVVEPITPREVELLLRKREPAPLPPQPIEATQTAPVKNIPISRPEPILGDTEKRPDIMVDISIGKGRVHLEAESEKVLETLINMLVAMGDRN